VRQYFCGPPLRRRFFGEPRAIPSHIVETQVPTAVISLLHKNRLIWFPNYAFARDSTARYLPLLFSKAFDFPQNWLDLLRRVNIVAKFVQTRKMRDMETERRYCGSKKVHG